MCLKHLAIATVLFIALNEPVFAQDSNQDQDEWSKQVDEQMRATDQAVQDNIINGAGLDAEASSEMPCRHWDDPFPNKGPVPPLCPGEPE